MDGLLAAIYCTVFTKPVNPWYTFLFHTFKWLVNCLKVCKTFLRLTLYPRNVEKSFIRSQRFFTFGLLDIHRKSDFPRALWVTERCHPLELKLPDCLTLYTDHLNVSTTHPVRHIMSDFLCYCLSGPFKQSTQSLLLNSNNLTTCKNHSKCWF